MAIKVTYKRTNRLSMRIVRNGDVHVSVPICISKKEVEAFISQHQEWIIEARKKTAERQKQRRDFYDRLPLITKTQKIEATERLRAKVDPMIARYTKVMGVNPMSISYKPMISRWGMCKVKECSICYSNYLLLLPDWCVEHVVVHELCHLLEPSHNARFHELMDKFYPKWKEARRETRRITKS